MDSYVVSLLGGVVGLGAMAASGLSHGGHVGHAGHGHAGHGHAGHAHGGPPHPASGHAGHDAHAPASQPGWQALLSPRLLFTLMVGFGAGGIAAVSLGEPWRLGAGILAAAGFEFIFVGPIWRFFFRFESQAASTLESSIEDEGRAVTGFDRNGSGLVALEVDGQIVQLLASLAPEDRARGVRVRQGDSVRVSSVDPERNRCIVRLPD